MYTNKSINTVIKELAICTLELLTFESELEFADNDGNHYRFSSNVPPELLQDLLNANVDFFSASDAIGCLYPSNTPVKNLLKFAEENPGCVFSTVLTYDKHGNLVKLSVDGLANYLDTSDEFAYALAAVAPSNTIIILEDDCVSAYMDMPRAS